MDNSLYGKILSTEKKQKEQQPMIAQLESDNAELFYANMILEADNADLWYTIMTGGMTDVVQQNKAVL